MLAGLAVRIWILLSSPMPPTRSVAWLAEGTLQDAAVLAVAGFLALVLASAGLPEAPVRIGFAVLVAAGALLHLAWAEAIVYFGHPPRREDLAIALDARFVAQSLERGAIARAAIGALGLAFLLCVTAYRARRAQRAWITRRRLIVGALAAGAGAFLAREVSSGETGANVLVTLWRLERSRPARRSGDSRSIPPPVLPVVSIRELAPQTQRRLFVSDERPLSHNAPPRSAAAPSLPAGVRPNVVFVLMEGVRAHEVGVRAGKLAGLTPNLDRLAAEGIVVDRAYSPGTRSPDGELAIWYGLLATPHEVLMTARPETALTGLPELLRAAGWKSLLWIHNSDQTFYREDRFYLPRGFRMIDGRDFEASEVGTNWGKSDRVLAARALTALDRLPEPFAAMMLTISNHHPFQVPADARSRFDLDEREQRGWTSAPWLASLIGRHTVPMLRTIHYTDEAIGEFLEGARKSPWFSRTIFVIASDHGLPILPLEGAPTSDGFADLRHRVPLIFWSPLLRGGRHVPGPASLADVPATLAGLLGLGPDRAGLGCDLLDPADDDPDRPVVAWDGEGRGVSLWTRRWAYHGTLPPGTDWNPGRFVDEILIDGDADPRGERNVAAAHPDVVARLGRLAQIYVDVYPWIVSSGRSGTAPDGARGPRP